MQQATGAEKSDLAANPANYNNDWPDKICPLMQQCTHAMGATNSFLIGFKANFQEEIYA